MFVFLASEDRVSGYKKKAAEAAQMMGHDFLLTLYAVVDEVGDFDGCGGNADHTGRDASDRFVTFYSGLSSISQ